MYNYREVMTQDVRDYISNNYDDVQDLNSDSLYDDMFCSDEVCGNGSCGYSISDEEAKNAVCDNMEILIEALEEFGTEYRTIGEQFAKFNFKYFDCTIRCYLLSQILESVLNEIKENEKEGE